MSNIISTGWLQTSTSSFQTENFFHGSLVCKLTRHLICPVMSAFDKLILFNFFISYKNESWLNRPGHYDLFFFSIPLPYICLNTEAATLVKLLFFCFF